MPEWLKFPSVLVIIAGVSAAALAGLNIVTSTAKLEVQAGITNRALSEVLPEAASFETVEADVDGSRFIYRRGSGADGSFVGYVVEGEADGYSSRIRVMSGVNPDFQIKAIKVLFQKETPGLGDKIEEIFSQKTWGTIISGDSPDESNLRPWFQIQFDKKTPPFAVQKDGGDIVAVTGATVSSRAVCKAVNDSVAKLRKILETPIQ